MILFFLAAVASLALIYGYFGIRIIRPSRLDRKWKIVLWAVLAVTCATLPLAIALQHGAPDNPITIPVSWFAYLTFGFFTLNFAGLLLRDMLFFVIDALQPLFARIRRLSPSFHGQMPKDSSRRQFLVNGTNLALLGVTGSLTGYGLAEARRLPEIVPVDVPLAGLPTAFDGFRILQITDLHVSMTLRRQYVQGVVDLANGQTPDMIVFTGDLADGRVDDLRLEAAPLAGLHAPFGKFFVTGNHEYYSGVDAWLNEVKRWGFTSLINSHQIIRRGNTEIVLAGVTDYRASQLTPAHASNPETALAGTPEDSVKVMLAHQPKSIYRAEPAGADLLITGHTHGGQYIPWNYMVPLDQPYVHGLHKHGKTQLYVSRGTGYWGPPVRVGAPSEITVLKLVRQPG